MAHLDRYRYIQPHIEEALSFSPIVGVVGQRQVGKTTIVERSCPDRYVTFDKDAEMAAAQTDPSGFLASRVAVGGKVGGALAIDECQMVPRLFPALKLFVQKRPRPGQFLLTGSIRFTSRKAIQESLTGRIHTIEMLPMSFAEAHRMPLGDVVGAFGARGPFNERYLAGREVSLSQAKVETFLDQGGLPGICFLREQSKRNSKFKSHLETLLQRDIRLIIETTVPYENLRALLTYFAASQGLPMNWANAARSTQISLVTLKKIVFAFENMFLVRRLTPLGDVASARFYMEDQGMASFLHRHTPLDDLRRFVFSQMFHQIHYRYMDVYRLGYYANRGGANLSFVFEVNKEVLGVDVCESPTPNMGVLRSAASFLRDYPKARVVIFSLAAKSPTFIGDGITVLPLYAVI